MRFKHLFESAKIPDVILKKRTHQAFTDSGFRRVDSGDDRYDTFQRTDGDFPEDALKSLGWEKSHQDGYMTNWSHPNHRNHYIHHYGSRGEGRLHHASVGFNHD